MKFMTVGQEEVLPHHPSWSKRVHLPDRQERALGTLPVHMAVS